MAEKPSAPGAECKAKVLIVEDDSDVRHMFATSLESKGYAVTSVGSAVEGLVAARDARPELIVMDLGLPDADGFQPPAP